MRRTFQSSCGESTADKARRRAGRLGVLLLGFLVTTTGRAWAEDPEAARQRLFREQYERAGRAYNDKDYAAAVPALQAAFAIQPLPQILFNIAQAYRRLEKWSSARSYFELYRSMSTNLTPEMTEQVDALVLEVSERERAAQPTKIVERTTVVYVQSEKPLPKWLRPVGISAGVVGLGLIAGGAAFLGLDGRCASAAVAPALECDQLYNTRTPGTALTVVGAGLFVVGAVTFGLSLRKPVRPIVREAPPSDTPLLYQLPSLPKNASPSDGSEPPPAGWNSDGTRARDRSQP